MSDYFTVVEMWLDRDMVDTAFTVLPTMVGFMHSAWSQSSVKPPRSFGTVTGSTSDTAIQHLHH
jgi:hypothetical protein